MLPEAISFQIASSQDKLVCRPSSPCEEPGNIPVLTPPSDLTDARNSSLPSTLWLLPVSTQIPQCTRRTRYVISCPFPISTHPPQYGRPFIILREQAKKTRTHGVEAIKVRQLVKAQHISLTCRSSPTSLQHGLSPTSSSPPWAREVHHTLLDINFKLIHFPRS